MRRPPLGIQQRHDDPLKRMKLAFTILDGNGLY